MIKVKPTENLTGVTIQGDFNDFYELVESIHRITGVDEDRSEIYYGVKHRLLGICYEIRHAFMGDREIILEENGMCESIMKWHEMITPTKNVYYSVNVLFPEAIFMAASVPKMDFFSSIYYGMYRRKRIDKDKSYSAMLYAEYIRDKANLEMLCAGVWQAVGEVIGDEELEKLFQMIQRTDESYMYYVTHYIDKCNIELLKTDVEKRRDKIRNIAKRIVKKPQAYTNMEKDLKFWAKEYNTSIYELEDMRIEYPDDFDW